MHHGHGHDPSYHNEHELSRKSTIRPILGGDPYQHKLRIESRLRQSLVLKQDYSSSESSSEELVGSRRRKKLKKRAKKRRKDAGGNYYKSKRDSSCSCTSLSSDNDGGCSCPCCCSSSMCSSSDSDERFARYYKLSSDEMELRDVNFPLEPKRKRREMTKLLLHTMVMWDDIWTGKITDNDDTRIPSSSSSSESTSSDGGAGNNKNRRKTEPAARVGLKHDDKHGKGDHVDDKGEPHRPVAGRDNEKIILEDKDLKDLAISQKLKQTLALKQEHGVFFSGKWYGLPIEEIDPFIYEDTYVVLSWRPKGPCIVYRYYKGDSLGLFAPDHPVRTFAFKVTTHRFFNYLITLTIFSNCISLAFSRYDYTEYGKKLDTSYDITIAIFELIFLSIYSIEMILKIIAKGFLFQKMAYLRNGWNLLDFTVVITNYISLTLELALSNDFDLDFEGTNYEFLRIFRVLRILKTVSILPGLRKIVTSLLKSSKQLLEVMGLMVFSIMMFSLFGMEFFSGRLRQKCVRVQGNSTEDSFMNLEGETIPNGLSNYMTDRLYGMWVENQHNWLWRDAPDSEPVPCGNSTTARHCPEGYVCLELAKSENPNFGWISFDSFFLAVIQTLQVMTLDYWERIYEFVLSTVGWEGTLYFALVIFFGGFYLLNLMLAVVTLCYNKEEQVVNVDQTQLSVPKRLSLTRNMSSFNFEHLNQQRLHLFEGFHQKTQRERDEQLLRMIKADEFAHPKMSTGQFESSQQFSHSAYRLLTNVGRYKNVPQVQKRVIEQKGREGLDVHRTDFPPDGFYDDFELFDISSDVELENPEDSNCLKLKNGRTVNFSLAGFDQTFCVPDQSRFLNKKVKSFEFELFPPENRWESLLAWLAVWRKATVPFVEDWKWKNLMIFAIFVNTVISCLEHHQQDLWMDHFIHLSNDFFTYLFCFELLLKAIAYQKRFLEYGWNKFDLWVVVGSVLDNILQLEVGYKGLRALKLLRILRLAQAWDTMKVLLNILFSAIGDMANLIMILFFAIYIFAMFGMQYIGSNYEPKNFMADYYPANYPRWAWQTALHSFLMVFRVVSGEWIELIWECFSALRIKKQEYKCFQTFIPMMVFGNFIILQLFLALLLHIFDADEINSLSRTVKADRRARGNTFRGNMNRLIRRLKGKLFQETEVEPGGPVKIKLKLKFRKVAPEEPDTPVASIVEEASVHEQMSTHEATSVRFATDDIHFTSSGQIIAVKASGAEESDWSFLIDSNLSVKEHDDEAAKVEEVVTPVEIEEPTPPPPPPPPPPRVEPKALHVIYPWKMPKWRFYKVVTRYVAVGDDDTDDEEGDLETHEGNFELADIEDEKIHIKNNRFRQVAYRIVMKIRKARTVRAIQKYIARKKKERHRNFLERTESHASKLSEGLSAATIHSEKGEEQETELVLDPCFPLPCFDTKWAFPCWLWGSRSSPCLDGFRMKCLRVVNHHNFEWVILVLIFSSSILLCFEDSNLEDKPLWFQEFLFWSGNVFTIIFFFEFILQLFARGLYGYFTNLWLILDFAVVWLGVISLILDLVIRYDTSDARNSWEFSNQLQSLKVLRTFRCIRPLRAISKWQGMRIVVNSLLQAIPAIFNVFCVCLVFWLVFAIMGVQFFKGRFHKCVNHLGEIVDATVAPNRQVCCQKIKSHNFAWVNSFPNFDSVPAAYLSLLYLATFEGWMDVIRPGIDARDVDQQPLRDYDLWAYVYFGLFCLFGGFLTTKLFIGVIIDNFNMLKNKFEGNLYEALMSTNQLMYYRAIKKLGRKRARVVIAKPKNPARLAFLEIAISQRTEFFMFIIIVCNMVVMCCDGYGNGVMADAILESLNAFFIFIYTLEAVVKILGLGRHYFRSAWNVFDLVILAISTVDYAIGDLVHHNFPVPPSVVRLCRILRVGRVMRIMKSAKGIRRLVFALFVSIPALFNIGALLVLVIFIYSILGMNLFGNFGHGGAFDEIVNFETFPHAFLLLFRMITIAGWNDVLGTLMPLDMICGALDTSTRECEDDCVSAGVAIFFVVTYILITNFVIVNMYIAIILENFDQANREDEFEVTGDDVEIFLDKWALFDGEATQFMELRYLSPFLDVLEPPLRKKYPNQTAITALNIPIYRGGLVQIYDVMRNLIVFVMGHGEQGQMEEIQKIINKRFAMQFRQKRILPLVATTRIWKVQHNAATSIQKYWRKYRKRKMKKEARAQNATDVPVQVVYNHDETTGTQGHRGSQGQGRRSSEGQRRKSKA